MFPIDHIPIFGGPTHNLSGLFRRLGFTVSPDAKYHSTKYPNAEWESSCVFFAESWFDLLRLKQPPAPREIRSSGCLFRVEDLDQALLRLPRETLTDRYDLVRTFEPRLNEQGERFEIGLLAGRYHGVFVSLACHGWPCVDVSPDWVDHPNGATGINGITTVSNVVDDPLFEFKDIADVSVLKYLPKDQFVEAFGDIAGYNVIGVDVSSVRNVVSHLATSDISHSVRSGVAVVVPPGARFAIAFSEA